MPTTTITCRSMRRGPLGRSEGQQQPRRPHLGVPRRCYRECNRTRARTVPPVLDHTACPVRLHAEALPWRPVGASPGDGAHQTPLSAHSVNRLQALRTVAAHTISTSCASTHSKRNTFQDHSLPWSCEKWDGTVQRQQEYEKWDGPHAPRACSDCAVQARPAG